MSSNHRIPVAVIGAGPVGLAAAAHLIRADIPVKVYEAGDTVAANVRDWAHVRLFSPWSLNADHAAKAILNSTAGRSRMATPCRPAAICTTRICVRSPTRRKCAPSSKPRPPSRRSRARHRQGGSRGPRGSAVFACWSKNGVAANGSGPRDHRRVRHVANPNPMGASGFPAVGETRASEFIAYGIPDVLGADRALYAGKRVLVVGGGHSAANVLLDLARLAETRQPDGIDLGAARRKPHAGFRRRRCRPAARARKARQRSQGAFG